MRITAIVPLLAIAMFAMGAFARPMSAVASLGAGDHHAAPSPVDCIAHCLAAVMPDAVSTPSAVLSVVVQLAVAALTVIISASAPIFAPSTGPPRYVAQRFHYRAPQRKE